MDRYLSWMLGLCALVLYLALPVRVSSYDSLAYAVETTSDILRRHFHPHHLLFSRTQLLFLYFIRIFDSGASPLSTMVWFNSILGALTLVFFHRIAFRISGRRLISTLVTVILAISWTYYSFSSSGDTVIPANFLLILALFLALGGRSHSGGRLTVIALIAGLAMLYHQMSIFYLPIIGMVALRACPRRQVVSRILLFLASSLGLTVVVYLAVMVFYYGFLNIHSWWAFLTSDTQQGGVWGSYNPWSYLKGLGYLLNSGTYAFSIEKPHGDELVWMIISRSLCWALAGLVVAIGVVRIFKREWFGVVVGGMLLLTMTFINWWEAPTTDYWVMPWMLVLLLLAWAGRGKLNTILAIWLIFYIPAQLTINWYYKMATLTDPESDLKGRIVGEMVRLITPGKAIVLTDDPNLALRSEMAGVHVVLFSRKVDVNRDAINTFVTLFTNPNTKDFQFMVSDSLYKEYKRKISLFIPPQLSQAVNVAFADAVPMAEVSNRWGFHLRIWLLGRVNP